MEFFKAFFLVLLFAVAPFGLSWLVENPDTNMFVAIGAGVAYVVGFCYVTILVAIGLDEWQ